MTFDSKPTKEQKLHLGLLIYHYRSAAGITQEEMAELLDCTPRWVQKIVGGQGNPNWVTLVKIMCLLQISPTQITEEADIHVYLYPLQRKTYIN